ncbi:hypothetical protein ABZS66_25770 [Dactylosporangium sp. NPDC005572]|uniref:hypothetical protein n=1 Tax=Dactylosporangium sp. NPDC005572 TaxID=3156889 RepID=UPI0033B46FFF
MRAARKFVSLLGTGSVVTAVAAVAVTVAATPASAAVVGREVITYNTGRTSDDKPATARCSTGKVVIGTAAWMVNAAGEVRITQLIPRLTEVFAYAMEDEDGTSAEWDLYVSAVCANPYPGLVIESETVSSSGAPWRSASATCPTGKHVLGTGFWIDRGYGQVGIEKVSIFDTDQVYALAWEDDTEYSGSWEVTAYAICSPPLPGLEIVATSSTLDSGYVQSQTASCPRGKVLIGGAGGVEYGSGQVVVEDFFNDDRRYTITAFEDDDGDVSTWGLEAYAICATP